MAHIESARTVRCRASLPIKDSDPVRSICNAGNNEACTARLVLVRRIQKPTRPLKAYSCVCVCVVRWRTGERVEGREWKINTPVAHQYRANDSHTILPTCASSISRGVGEASSRRLTYYFHLRGRDYFSIVRLYTYAIQLLAHSTSPLRASLTFICLHPTV